MSQDADKPPVEVKGKILHETAKAILLEVEGTGIWFPLSQTREIHRDSVNIYESRLVVEHWIAYAKGVA